MSLPDLHHLVWSSLIHLCCRKWHYFILFCGWVGRFFLLLLFSCSVVFNSLQHHGLQHARHSCPLQSPKVCSNLYLLSQWCHPTISSSVIPFFSYLQPFPASGSFLMSQLFASGCQSIGALASASVLPMNIQDWFPLGLTGLISLLSKGLSGVFSSTTVWRHQFFSAQLSHLYMTTGKPIDDSFTWSFLSESITK